MNERKSIKCKVCGTETLAPKATDSDDLCDQLCEYCNSLKKELFTLTREEAEKFRKMGMFVEPYDKKRDK